MPFTTELTRKLGIKSQFKSFNVREASRAGYANRYPVPVVQGGMQWVGYAELASAVSNAGGLGIVRVSPSSSHISVL